MAGVALPTKSAAGEAETLIGLVDRTGMRFSEVVPFEAHRIRIGRQADGTLVAAFGDTRLNSR